MFGFWSQFKVLRNVVVFVQLSDRDSVLSLENGCRASIFLTITAYNQRISIGLDTTYAKFASHQLFRCHKPVSVAGTTR